MSFPPSPPPAVGPAQPPSQFGPQVGQYPVHPGSGYPPYSGTGTGYPAYPGAGFQPGALAPADVGARLGARLIDLVFWFVGYGVLAVPLAMWIDRSGPAASGVPRTVLICWLVASLALYFPFSIGKFGMTLGKRICGIRIVRRVAGEPVGFWRAVGRESFWLVAIVIPVLSLLDPLWCYWDKPFRQCLHDKVADTMAVER
ncbi:RDD family protein [Streptomyces sp. H10-C2]|uniref:RDD family protein n=1 Tax=unclassified Streptomyces TaxID=2593676 RepID=UPI0024BB063C|nr:MULTISPECIES: RDD family protein [unclassified Streptomyces]MDJ0345622.1 RDD family protein [Streptomyces sp. PH10-H1]MDJ0372987.1 RDD family protein [Streptomyces sp. H10-C2]